MKANIHERKHSMLEEEKTDVHVLLKINDIDNNLHLKQLIEYYFL